MQFQKKTRAGTFSGLMKIVIKIAFVSNILLLLIVLVDKINFPYPSKEIKKIIPNETFKVVK